MSLIGFLGLAAVVRADLIYFNKGSDAQLPARVEGNRVLVSMPDGEVELTRDNVRKIIPGFWPDASGLHSVASAWLAASRHDSRPPGGPLRTD